MSLEFDPRSGFAQKEDKIGELLIPRRSGQAPPSFPLHNKPTEESSVTSSIIGVGVDDLYAEWDRYALDFPPGLILLPGKYQQLFSLASLMTVSSGSSKERVIELARLAVVVIISDISVAH